MLQLATEQKNDEFIFANLNKSHKLLLKLPLVIAKERTFQIDRRYLIREQSLFLLKS